MWPFKSKAPTICAKCQHYHPERDARFSCVIPMGSMRSFVSGKMIPQTRADCCEDKNDGCCADFCPL
jgi:hypothetical protein